MDTLKLKIPYEDRLGLVLDVSKVLFNHGLNIVALQLVSNVMFLEIENHLPETWPLLKEELEGVYSVLSVERINDMPYQSREKQIEAIINSISPSANPSQGFGEIVGVSHAIKKAIALAEHVANTDTTIMLRGESGTGKELFARAIHMHSRRRDKVFVPINCGALPESLLESELFGYVEGAFTGAKKGGRVGLFQFASGGTIFLDEISDLPMPLQVKLLRVLQEGKVRPLGANEEIPVNCRVITATNRNIEEMVQKGTFREDLYYRLNVIPIQIPPLRQRKEDIVLLAENYLTKHKKRCGVEKYLTAPAVEKLVNYSWYGNVRELENVLERALHLSAGQEITTQHIIFDGEGEVAVAVESTPERIYLKRAAAQAEKEVILSALKTYGSVRKAAKALGVSHTTISNKIKKLGIETGK
ncbi:MAG: sigma 54-interacting transcriptional regulator [Bacillota bacterium]|uniref:HTH-type transcriptional regulatory protein TyrR n=1 Tax=Thermanaerosceptrum fracticalcis TaxID=1712410 RepID=A0A7G6E1X2_THEFR|nr:sigma 54-interacting transcriptional regulator [Thermanaerosceptrum fracticalcis]QNB46076.1 AAA domain-containing protein [Thermanaerosceptrum fracticalcis]